MAEVSSVPDEYSVRQGESKEGEIEARTIKGSELLEAAAVGAAKGGAPGVAAHNAKAAATGAAASGIAGFLDVLWNRQGNRFAEKNRDRPGLGPAFVSQLTSAAE